MTTKIAYLGVKGLPSKGGADRVVEAIVQRLDKHQYEPTVYCSSRAVPKDTCLQGVDLIRIPTLRGKHLHATSLFLLSALHALCFGNYDIVHVHNVEACFVLPFLRPRYKVISTSHGTAQARDKWGKVAKALMRLTEYPYMLFSNCITSVSQPLASDYQRQYKKKVHYLPNGVDADSQVDMETAEAILKANAVEAGNYILFAAGRIIPTKGCHLLLEAFRGLEGETKLLIAGDDTQVAAYQRQLRKMADDRVRFIPFISAKETLLGLVRACRLFVFPSTVEAMSMMLLEVASLGVPIVCSDIRENVCVLPERALFFESGNAKDLQAKLQWALEHPKAIEDLATKAHNWVNENYRWDSIIKEYELLYETI